MSDLQKLIDAGIVIFAGDRLARWYGSDLRLLPNCLECGEPMLEDSISAEYDQCVECGLMDGVDTEL